MGNFHVFWFLVFEYARGVTQFRKIFRDEAFSKISKCKVTNLRIPGFFLNPHFDFFWNSQFSFLSQVDFGNSLSNIPLDDIIPEDIVYLQFYC